MFAQMRVVLILHTTGAPAITEANLNHRDIYPVEFPRGKLYVGGRKITGVTECVVDTALGRRNEHVTRF